MVWTLRLDRCMHAIFFSLRGYGWGGGEGRAGGRSWFFLSFLSFFLDFSWIALGCALLYNKRRFLLSYYYCYYYYYFVSSVPIGLIEF